MKYLSVCAGIEAASVAWHHMGWEPVAFSEIEKFPSAVLAHHYPNVPNWGDMTRFQEWPDACGCVSNRQHELLWKTNRAFNGLGREECSAIHFEQGASSCGGNRSSNKGHICEVCNGTIVDVLVGGTPCQSFSVAGLRKGLDDPRGNLMLTFGSIAQRYRPEWLVWENVPGVLSSNGGRDFGSFLGMLAELGYGFAFRVLDAQFHGVAQRRRRLFLVGHLGDWHRAAAVLFERHSLSGHPAPSRQARKGTAGSVAPGATASGWPAEVSPTLNAHFGSKQGLEDQHIAGGGDCLSPTVAMCLITKTRLDSETETLIPTIGGGFDAVAIGLDEEQNARVDGFGTLKARMEGGGFEGTVMTTAMQVRRLTPVECERLQGFPDGYTNIPWRNKPESPDGPRYKALGNSMAVPVMRWIGERINKVSKL